MQRFAKELVALAPDVILSHTTPTTTALLQQTRTIPIVFTIVGDPIGSGFVASFPRPGGNVTGFNVSEPTQGGKWVELLKEIAPRVARIAMLFNPALAPYADYWLNPFKAAATSLPVKAFPPPVRDGLELDSVVAARAREPNGGRSPSPAAVRMRRSLAVSREKDGKLRIVHAGWCNVNVVQPDGYGQARSEWRGGSTPPPGGAATPPAPQHGPTQPTAPPLDRTTPAPSTAPT